MRCDPRHAPAFLAGSRRIDAAPPTCWRRPSRAYAALQGRDFVIPDDVKTLAQPVLRHRVVLSPGGEIEGLTTDKVICRNPRPDHGAADDQADCAAPFCCSFAVVVASLYVVISCPNGGHCA